MGVCERHRQTGREPYIGRQIGGDLTQASFPLLIRQTDTELGPGLSVSAGCRQTHFHNITLCIPSSCRTHYSSLLPASLPSVAATPRLGLDQFNVDAYTGHTLYRKYCTVARMRPGVVSLLFPVFPRVTYPPPASSLSLLQYSGCAFSRSVKMAELLPVWLLSTKAVRRILNIVRRNGGAINTIMVNDILSEQLRRRRQRRR